MRGAMKSSTRRHEDKKKKKQVTQVTCPYNRDHMTMRTIVNLINRRQKHIQLKRQLSYLLSLILSHVHMVILCILLVHVNKCASVNPTIAFHQENGEYRGRGGALSTGLTLCVRVIMDKWHIYPFFIDICEPPTERGGLDTHNWQWTVDSAMKM